jgi:hypothetical protein
MKLTEKTKLYEVLKLMPTIDSISTYFSEYHNEYLDQIHFNENRILFNSKCNLIRAEFFDSDLNLVLDDNEIQIGSDIHQLRDKYNKSANTWRNHSNYKTENNGSLQLDLVNGNYLSIGYNSMKITRIKLITEM